MEKQQSITQSLSLTREIKLRIFTFTQLVWWEALISRGEKPNQTTTRKSGMVKSNLGEYPFTTNPASPVYRVDSTDPDSPYYDSRGLKNRKANSLTIYDQPGDHIQSVKDEMGEAGVSAIILVGHYDTFVFYDGYFLNNISWTVTYTWTRKTSGIIGPNYRVVGNGCSKPSPGELKAFLYKYPAFYEDHAPFSGGEGSKHTLPK